MSSHGTHDSHDFELMLTQDHSRELGHIVPNKLFLKVFLTLLGLTVLTVTITRFDFGAWNIVVAMVIASAKALLVASIFMHLKYESKLLWIYAIFPFILLAILIGGVLTDNPFRDHPELTKMHHMDAPAQADSTTHGETAPAEHH